MAFAVVATSMATVVAGAVIGVGLKLLGGWIWASLPPSRSRT
jgi:hypothetical protein